MPRKPPPIQSRALHHMRDRQASGWHEKSAICDYATAALEMENYDADRAANAVEICWSRYFATMPPI